MSPRISFSNDFVESSTSTSTTTNSRHQHLMNLQASSRSPSDAPPPLSSDFEFSVSSYSMMSADELFSKGRLLPYKNNPKTAVTLRDELLTGGDDDDNGPNGGGSSSSSGANNSMMRPPKGGSGGRWKGLLGLRKSHVAPKKPHREDQVQATTQHYTAGNDE